MLTWFMTSKEGTAGSGLTVSHQESAETPREEIKSLTTLKTEENRTVTFYGHTQKLSGSLFPEGAMRKAVIRFLKSSKSLSKFIRWPLVVAAGYEFTEQCGSVGAFKQTHIHIFPAV